MIYIKDYASLNSYVFNNQLNAFELKLAALKGRTITVFVASGGIVGNCFTGVLIEVLSDSIKLITKLPEIQSSTMHNCGNRFNKPCSQKRERLGTSTFIMVDHITALSYSNF